jgi:chromosome segregation ATPase
MNIEQIKQKFEKLGQKEVIIKHTISEKEKRRKLVKELERQKEDLQQSINFSSEAVSNLQKSISQKTSQIETTTSEITHIKAEIKSLQESINAQLLTSYEKEIAMQDIESLHQKKMGLEKANGDLAREINEGNRELHVRCAINFRFI